MTGPQVRQSSSYQGGRTGQGKEVVAGKLGSGSFLQVAACKLGDRSLLPVEAGKIEVYIIRELYLSSSYFWTTIIKKDSVVLPLELGFPR